MVQARVGLGCFRLAIGRRDTGLRLGGGICLAGATLLGAVSGLVELVVLLAGSMVILALERQPVARHTGLEAFPPAR